MAEKSCLCSSLIRLLSVRPAKNRFCSSPSKILRFGGTELKSQHLHGERKAVKGVVREFNTFLTLSLESRPSASLRAQLDEELFPASQTIYKVICQNQPPCTGFYSMVLIPIIVQALKGPSETRCFFHMAEELLFQN